MTLAPPPRLPLHQCFENLTGMVELPKAPSHSYAVDGRCYGAHADARLWHARLRRMLMEKLVIIHELGLVDGLSVHGKISKFCKCDVCVQAKIRRSTTPRTSPAADIPRLAGHTEGDTNQDRERRQAGFTKVCGTFTPKVHHIFYICGAERETS